MTRWILTRGITVGLSIGRAHGDLVPVKQDAKGAQDVRPVISNQASEYHSHPPRLRHRIRSDVSASERTDPGSGAVLVWSQ